jgi:hypothetical protein
MLVALCFQHRHCVSIQRKAARRAILGLVQPRCPALQVDAVPFQSGNLARPATRRQREADERLQVRRGGRDQAVRLFPRQPAITFISPDSKRIFGLTSIHCHSSRAMRNRLRRLAR